MDPTFQKVSSVGLNRTDRPDRKGRKKAFLFLRFETEIVPFRIGFHDAKRVSPSLRDVRDVPRIASSSFHVEEELDLLDLSMLETDDVASERESEVGSCFRRSERRGKEEESTHGPDRSAFLDPSRRDLRILSKNEWNRFPFLANAFRAFVSERKEPTKPFDASSSHGPREGSPGPKDGPRR